MKRTLIVDPNGSLATEITPLLLSIGSTVTSVHEFDHLAETVGSRRYETALLNVTDRDEQWRETWQELKQTARTTTLIAISMVANESELPGALSAGAYVVLDSPMSRESLGNLVRSENDGLFVFLRR